MQCDSVSLNVSRDHRSRKATTFFFFGGGGGRGGKGFERNENKGG